MHEHKIRQRQGQIGEGKMFSKQNLHDFDLKMNLPTGTFFKIYSNITDYHQRHVICPLQVFKYMIKALKRNYENVCALMYCI